MELQSAQHTLGLTTLVSLITLQTAQMELKFPQVEAVSHAQVSTLRFATPLVLTGTSILTTQLARTVPQNMASTVFSAP